MGVVVVWRKGLERVSGVRIPSDPDPRSSLMEVHQNLVTSPPATVGGGKHCTRSRLHVEGSEAWQASRYQEWLTAPHFVGDNRRKDVCALAFR